MTKEQFIEIIKGFDIKEIEEYKIKYKDSENHSVTIELGFDEEDNNDVNVANTIIFDLQDRIDEAIEYMDNLKVEDFSTRSQYGYILVDYNRLVSILMGKPRFTNEKGK